MAARAGLAGGEGGAGGAGGGGEGLGPPELEDALLTLSYDWPAPPDTRSRCVPARLRLAPTRAMPVAR